MSSRSRALVMRDESLPPIVGRLNDELLFIQHHNVVMILAEKDAREVADSLLEEIAG